MTRLDTGSEDARPERVAAKLSPRQREILDLVAAGRTSKEIAVALGISESTVNWHLANAFSRLGASSRAEAVALSLRADGNGALAEQPTTPYARPPQYRSPLPVGRHFVAVAIAIALAGALVGGATVAALRGGFDFLLPEASPSLRPIVTASPSRGSGLGESTAPSRASATAAPAAPTLDPIELVPAEAPATPAPPIPMPVSTAPPPAVPALTPLPTAVLPAPLPTVLPTPLPTAVLPTPLISPLPVPSLPPVPIATPSPPRLP